MAPKAKEKPKPSPSPSPASQPAIAVEDLFTTLNRHIQRSDEHSDEEKERLELEQAVKVADQVLSIVPNDEDAIRCKIVALIRKESIGEALATVEASRRIQMDLSFYKAYCLYRQNKLNEALEALKGQEGNSAIMLLQSQILFRMGEVDASLDIYQKLQKSKIKSLDKNFIAAFVSAGRASEVQGVMEALRLNATSSFELAYNTACSLIERNKYSDAEQLLLSARRIRQEALMEEDYPDYELETKLAPITVQLAHVRQLLGHTQEAIEAFTDIIKRNLADERSLVVATNNLVSLKGSKDVSDSLRKLDRLIEKGSGTQTFQLVHELDLQFSSKQREAIYTNRLLLLLHSNKMDQARELVAALPDMFPDSVIPVLLQAAVFVRENRAGRAEEILCQYSEKFPDKSNVVLLVRAQVAASAGHPQVAAESLSKIPEIQHMPATVATLVSLKERAGDINGAVSIFDSAINWWASAMSSKDNKRLVIMHEAAAFKLKHGRKEEAAKLYEELVKSHGSVEALVGLIKTAAFSDKDKAEAYEKKLKPLPGLNSVDVDALEKTSGAKHMENGPHVGTVESSESKSKEKAKKKRKSKPRYPKGFDPANPGPPPDPERWLPKRERSSFRPKRKDKRAAQVRGSQGVVAKEAANANAKSNQATSFKGASQNAVADQPRAPPSKSSRKKSRN